MDVSIIIVSFNAKEVLKKCLDAVFTFTQDISFEVIVVDNASTDGAIGVLKDYEKKYQNLKVIYSRENTGFAKGNNLGIAVAKGKYILLLNNDAILLENSCKLMYEWLDTHHNVGAGSCILLDNDQKISSIISAGFFPNLKDLWAWAFFLDDLPLINKFFKPFHIHAKLQKPDVEFFPDWVSGSFLFVRKDVLDKIGGLDDSIFMYGEDLDLCYRIKQAGWKIGYTAATRVVHIGQVSQNKLPKGSILGEFKGIKYFYAKHYPQWKQMVLDLLLDIAAFNRIIFWLVKLKPQMSQIYLEAMFV